MDTYCKHGVYVGYPGGPDYLCGACEDGADTLIEGWFIALTHKGRPNQGLGVIYQTTSDENIVKRFDLWRTILRHDKAGEWSIQRHTFREWVRQDEVLPEDVIVVAPEWGFSEDIQRDIFGWDV